jgi:hypothetical protein
MRPKKLVYKGLRLVEKNEMNLLFIKFSFTFGWMVKRVGKHQRVNDLSSVIQVCLVSSAIHGIVGKLLMRSIY